MGVYTGIEGQKDEEAKQKNIKQKQQKTTECTRTSRRGWIRMGRRRKREKKQVKSERKKVIKTNKLWPNQRRCRKTACVVTLPRGCPVCMRKGTEPQHGCRPEHIHEWQEKTGERKVKGSAWQGVIVKKKNKWCGIVIICLQNIRYVQKNI
jgi:hypothetical protein